MNIHPTVPCVKCSVPLVVKDTTVADYLQGKKEFCHECKEELDWWEIIYRGLRLKFVFFNFGPIGAKSKLIKIKLLPNINTTLKFSDHGIPEDARILFLNYTPQSMGLFPLEIHGNSPQRHIIPSEITLYPMPRSSGPNEETEVAVYVTWVPHTPDDESRISIVDAFYAYSIDRYESMVLSANVAVELLLKRLLMSYFEKIKIAKDKRESFLNIGATYGHQLNVVLPSLISFTKAPHLPEHICALLNRLKNLRNEIAHSGMFKVPIKEDQAAEYLCAALFGFCYINLIRPILVE